MRIKDGHMRTIARGVKNSEYKTFSLPSTVERIWFYTLPRVSAFQYVAQIGPGKELGEVPEN